MFKLINLSVVNSRKRSGKFNLTSLDNRDDSADIEYWNKYETLIDDKKEKLWDAILYGLQKYQLVF